MNRDTLTAQLTLVVGMQFIGSGSTHHGIVMDSDFEGGIPIGNKPMELVLLALGSCTGMDVISILRKKRQEVTSFEIELTGVRTNDYPKIFQEITITYLFKGKALSPQAIERAIELSQEKYCSVSAMLKKTTKIRTSYKILE